MFKPRISEVTIEDGDETEKFYVREPSGREVLEEANNAKRNSGRMAIDNARDLFKKYLVTALDDSTPLPKDTIEEILNFRLSAMHKLSDAVSEKIGLSDLIAKKA